MNEKDDNNTTVSLFKEEVEKFIKERDWSKYHTPKNLIQALGIEVGELSELFLFKEDNLDNVLKILPSITNPTISQLVNKNSKTKWVDILVVLDKEKVRELILELKKVGAVGIVEFPLNKVI